MKKIIFVSLIVVNFLPGFSQDKLSYFCTYGFIYELSQQKSYGYNEPVILSVMPGTSAAEAGLQPNDIIVQINGQTTKDTIIDKIDEWMHDVYIDQITLTISNLKEIKEVVVQKKCYYSNMIPEKDLSGSYSFYSIEDVQKRAFVCPFKTTIDPDINLLTYKTFGFSKINEQYQELETAINESIKTELENKGLRYTGKNPDLIIYTYYSYSLNPNYRSKTKKEKLPNACRYNVYTKKMQYLPILDTPIHSAIQAEYTLQLGIRMASRQSKVVWECEANEWMKQSNYDLKDYAQFHIPLMLMQYPFTKSTDAAKFVFSTYKYNYTGLYYNLQDMTQIIDIDENSPASQAGIKKGDWISKINDIEANEDPKNADARYKMFISETMKLRDPRTQFINAYGFARCAYWDKTKYPLVAKAFKNPEYQPVFSYLFYFEPYINPSKRNVLTFDVKRGKSKQKFHYTVRPEIREEQSFETVK
ncbi:hypothetical protein AGMMS50262_19770 [Bacteroidia bacterium]|nr:hypothetical protein AGMMS50262_19770 [Bacteroidia bacterium]